MTVYRASSSGSLHVPTEAKMQQQQRIRASPSTVAKSLARTVLLPLLLLSLITGADTAIFKGSIKSPSSWAYIGRFCFWPTAVTATSASKPVGVMTVSVSFPYHSRVSVQYFINYDKSQSLDADSSAGWKEMYKSGMTCTDRARTPGASCSSWLSFVWDPVGYEALREAAATSPPPPPSKSGRRSLLQQQPPPPPSPSPVQIVPSPPMPPPPSPPPPPQPPSLQPQPPSPPSPPPLLPSPPPIPVGTPSPPPSPSPRIAPSPPPPPSSPPPPLNTQGTTCSFLPSWQQNELDQMDAELDTWYKYNGLTDAFLKADQSTANPDISYATILQPLSGVETPVKLYSQFKPGTSLYSDVSVDNVAKRVTVKKTLFFASDRERWFYIAVGNCGLNCTSVTGNCGGNLDVDYEMLLTNGDTPGTRHFSADEAGVLEMSVVFVIFQVGLLGMAYFVCRALHDLDKLHHTVKILVASIVIQFFSQLFDAIQYGAYATDGVGSPGLRIAARLLRNLADLCLIVLLIVVGKGWTICVRKVSAQSRWRIAVFATAYLCLFVVLEVVNGALTDPAIVIYAYDTVPGYLLCVMRVLAMFWFWRAVFVTLKKYHTKRGFYRKFTAFYSLWLLTLPVIVLIALGLEEWRRAKVVKGLELTVMYLAQAAMIAMYNPRTRFNKSFPFHSKTTEMADGRVKSVLVSPNLGGGANGNGASGANGGSAAEAEGGTPGGDPAGSPTLRDRDRDRNEAVGNVRMLTDAVTRSQWDENRLVDAVLFSRAILDTAYALLSQLEKLAQQEGLQLPGTSNTQRSLTFKYAVNSLGVSSLFKPGPRAARVEGGTGGDSDLIEGRADSSQRPAFRPPQSSVEARIRAAAAGGGGGKGGGGDTYNGGQPGPRKGRGLVGGELGTRVGAAIPRKFKEPMSEDDEWDQVGRGSAAAGAGSYGPAAAAAAGATGSSGGRLGSGGRARPKLDDGSGSEGDSPRDWAPSLASGQAGATSGSQHMMKPARGAFPPRRSRQGSVEMAGAKEGEPSARIGRAVEPIMPRVPPPVGSTLPLLGSAPPRPLQAGGSSGPRSADWPDKGLGSPRARAGAGSANGGGADGERDAPGEPSSGGNGHGNGGGNGGGGGGGAGPGGLEMARRTGKALPELPRAPGASPGNPGNPGAAGAASPPPPPRPQARDSDGPAGGGAGTPPVGGGRSGGALPPPPMLSGPLLSALGKGDGGGANDFAGGGSAGKQPPLPPLAPRSLSSLSSAGGFRRTGTLTRGEQLKAIATSPPQPGASGDEIDDF